MARNWTGWACVLLLAHGVTGCTNADAPAIGEPTLAQLVPAQSCPTLLADLKAQAMAEMNRRIDENLLSALSSGADRCWGGEEDAFANASGGQRSGPAPAPTAPSGGAKSVSTTNNQVVGVDEADFVKNDNRYVYILAAGRLQIIDAWPPAQAHVVSRTAIGGELKKLFVHEDHAFVYSSPSASSSSWNKRECTYGYSCDFTGDGKPTTITVLDIADRTQPRLVRVIDLPGSLLAARRINGAVHTALTFPPAAGIKNLKYWPDDWNYCEPHDALETLFTFEALRSKNAQAINESGLDLWLPSATDSLTGETAILGSCNDYYVSRLSEGQAFLSILSLDSAGAGELHATTVVGQPGAVYSSSDAMYVSARHQQQQSRPWFFDGSSGITSASTVHKFRLAGTTSAYAGSGVVKGHVLGQFSLDEHRGYLRIATTSGHVPDPKVHSTITVLRESAGGLEVTGAVDDIAPTEDIRSVRFDGERGFVVTFKKTDPLFSLDLANPYKPMLVGQLKIPGFSTYMHLMDDNHLLSIGYDAEDHGSFAYFRGVLLQIFDISDLANPTLAHRTSIGTRGSSSEALTNHLAFNLWNGMLAVPMTICEGTGTGGSFGDRMTFSGLQVWDVSTATGFALRGGVAHVAAASAPTTRTCSSWWTDASSEVKRSIFMDEYVLSIARDVIHIQDTRALGSDVAAVPLVAE